MFFAQVESTLTAQIIGGYVMGLLAASMAGWFWIAQRRQLTGCLLEQREGRLPPWGVGDLVLMIFLWLASQVVGIQVATRLGGFPMGVPFDTLTIDQKLLTINVATSVQWAAIAIFLVWLRFGVGATWKDIGLSWQGVGNDVIVGVFGFVLITPPVLTLQTGLGALFPDQQHPFIEAMRDGSGLRMIGAITYAAVISAPWLEEFMFRSVILGWLERFAHGMELDRNAAEAESGAEGAPLEHSLASLSRSDPSEGEAKEAAAGWRPLPIVISALLFGLVHFGHGPAPISLFFFALGLGYIYQRTRRLLPCVIIHTLLNGQTTAMLFLLSGAGEAAS